MGKKSVRPEHRYSIIADAVGIAHFIVANFIVALGQTTEMFKEVSYKYGGLEFVYQYFDTPVYTLFSGVTKRVQDSVISTFIVGEFIILISSIFYGLLAYILLRIISGGGK